MPHRGFGQLTSVKTVPFVELIVTLSRMADSTSMYPMPSEVAASPCSLGGVPACLAGGGPTGITTCHSAWRTVAIAASRVMASMSKSLAQSNKSEERGCSD